jgi:hypothetical protein
MSTSPAVIGDNQVKTKKRPLVPPEPKFWKRYSPHHEFSWSSLISACIYIIAGLLIYALVRLAIQDNNDNKSLPVAVVDLSPAGSGGNIDGVGFENPGGEFNPTNKEKIADAAPTTTTPPTPAPPDLKPVESKPDIPSVAAGNPAIDEGSEQAMDALNRAGAAASERLKNALSKPPGKGEGGTGIGGKAGDGSGNKPGPGSGSIRQERLSRWTVHMKYDGRASLREDTRSYMELLKILGAVLAIPNADGTFLVVRELTSAPLKAERQTLEQLESYDRIFFKDDKPTFLSGLAHELGLRGRPPFCFAFFPEAFEKELVEKESSHRGKKESEIEHTWFEVTRTGANRYAIRVTRQKPD